MRAINVYRVGEIRLRMMPTEYAIFQTNAVDIARRRNSCHLQTQGRVAPGVKSKKYVSGVRAAMATKVART